MRVSGARTPLGELRSANTSPGREDGESVSDATSKIPAGPRGPRTGERRAVPLHQEQDTLAPPSPQDSAESTTATQGSRATPVAVSQPSKLIRPVITPSSVPAKLSRFAPAAQREAHRQSQGAAATEQRRGGGKRSRLASRATRNAAHAGGDSGSLKPLVFAEPVSARPAAATGRTPRSTSAGRVVLSGGSAGSVSKIPSCPTSSAAGTAVPAAAGAPDSLPFSAGQGTCSGPELPLRTPSESPLRIRAASPEPEPANRPFGKLYGNELYEASPRGLRSSPGQGESPPPPLFRSLSDWKPATEPASLLIYGVAESPVATHQELDASARIALTPEAQVRESVPFTVCDAHCFQGRS